MAEPHAELRSLLSLRRTRTLDDYRRIALLSSVASDQSAKDAWGERDAAELTAVLTEYETLRHESMNAINNRIQVMMLGVAAILAIGGGAMAGASGPFASLVLLAAYCYAIPLVFAFVLLVWLSEAVRAHRVGYFIASNSEARINSLTGRFSVSWETALWTGLMPRDEFLGPSMAAMLVLAAISLAAPVLGVLLTGWRFSLSGLPSLHLVIPYTSLAVVAGYVWANRHRLLNITEIRALGQPEIDAN